MSLNPPYYERPTVKAERTLLNTLQEIKDEIGRTNQQLAFPQGGFSSMLNQAYPLDNSEFAFVSVRNSVPNVNLIVSFRILRSDTKTFDLITLTTPSGGGNLAIDRSLITVYSTVPLPSGWLISVVVQGGQGVALGKRGQTFLQAGLIQNPKGTINSKMLISDYIHSGYLPAWPTGAFKDSIEGPGYIYNPAPASPAAGAEMAITIPTNAIWRIISLDFNLACSAAVGTRNVNLVVKSAAIVLESITSTYFVTPTANQNIEFALTEGGTMTGAAATTTPPILFKHTFPAGLTIKTSTIGTFDVADQYSINGMLVEEWILT